MKKAILNIWTILGSSLFIIMAADGLADSREAEVIATLNGEPIYLSDVEPNVSFRLYRLRTNIYTLLKMETEEIVNQKLLTAEAEKQGLSVKALLKKEVDDKVSPPEEKEVDAYLAERPEEGLKDPKKRNRIRTFLFQKALSERKREYLASLQKKADFRLLLELPKRPRMRVDIQGEPWRGNPAAPVTLVHFASFTCLACSKSAQMISRAMEEFPDKIKWVHRNLFTMYDEKALTAARVGDFAHEKEKFWDFHDKIWSLNGQFEEEGIFQIAEDLGLNRKDYDDGEKAGRFLLAVSDDIRDAQKLGISTAPVIFVNGVYFHGTFPYDQLKTLLKKEMDRTGKKKEPKP